MFFIKYLFYLYHFICDIVSAILKMRNQDGVSVYTFKMLQFEKIQPIKCPRTPLPRSGHRIVCDSKNFYSFGGYNPLIEANEETTQGEDDLNVNSFPLFQELWRYNFASKKWTRYNNREDLPLELASVAVMRLGNYLMVYSCVYGGTGSPFGYRCSNQLYICSLSSNNSPMVEIVTTGQLPMPQYGQALVYHNNHIYTIGGTTGFLYTCDIHRLNMFNKVWEAVYVGQGEVNIEPQGRYRHEVAYDGNNIYILGGGTSEVVYDFCEIPTFDLETNQWHKTKTKADNVCSRHVDFTGFPSARRCHGAVQIDTDNGIQVFMTGGCNGEIIFDDLWRLELATMQWTWIEKCILPHPTYFHSAAVTPSGRMYIFGGIYAKEDTIRSNDIYSTWLCIPKLSEMCWEALLYYKPHLVNYNHKKLTSMGFPKHFIERLEL